MSCIIYVVHICYMYFYVFAFLGPCGEPCPSSSTLSGAPTSSTTLISCQPLFPGGWSRELCQIPLSPNSFIIHPVCIRNCLQKSPLLILPPPPPGAADSEFLRVHRPLSLFAPPLSQSPSVHLGRRSRVANHGFNPVPHLNHPHATLIM